MSHASSTELMYNAILQIGCVAFESASEFRSPEWRLARIREISDAALREMNSEHTAEVQKFLLNTRREKKKK